jgi:hypothetical protein
MRPLHLRFAAAALALALAGGDAQAQSLRFTETAPGSLRVTGNTLGLSKQLSANGPGLEDSIGTFVSLSGSFDDVPLNAANPWPAGTTYDWQANGSSAVLDLPPECEVLYAELLWGGSYDYPPDVVTAQLDTPVTLTMGNDSMAVAPAPSTALTIAQVANSGFDVKYYMRSADVTAFVQAAGEGEYAVSGVPATQTTTVNSLNAAGWTLVVAYRSEAEPTRNLSIFVGGSFVDEESQQDYAISGFCAPPAGVVEGVVVSSTIEGDADLTGDQLLIGPGVLGPFEPLSGPNNPEDNFFASQLNDQSGQLDPQGTFGNTNHDAQNGVNVSGGRQGWDVTTVPLSSLDGQLENGQTSAVVRTITFGDSYVPILAGLAIDVNAPDFTASGATMTASKSPVSDGDVFTVDVVMENLGDVTAEGLTFALSVPAGLTLSSYATDGTAGDIGGNPVDAATLAAGAAAGALGAGQTRNLQLGFEVSAAPSGLGYVLSGTWSYSYQVCTGDPPLPETFTQVESVAYQAPPIGSGGAGGEGGAASGPSSSGAANGGSQAGGAGSGAQGTSGSGGSGAAVEAPEPGLNIDVDGGGCSCGVPRRGPSGVGVLAAAVLLGLRRRRRRSWSAPRAES